MEHHVNADGVRVGGVNSRREKRSYQLAIFGAPRSGLNFDEWYWRKTKKCIAANGAGA